MNKRFTVMTMLLVLVACLTCGCEALDPVTRSDAKRYVENNLGLKNYSIKMLPSDEGKGDSFTWEVYDKDNDVSFDVYGSITGYGDYIPSFTMGIYDNYSENLYKKKSEELPEGVEYAQHGTDRNIEEKDGFFVVNYTDTESLEKNCNAFWELAKEIRKFSKDPVQFKVKLAIPHDPEIDKIYYPPLDFSMGDYYGQIGQKLNDEQESERSAEDLIGKVKLLYFTYGYTYRIPDVMEEMSDRDVENVLDDNYYRKIYIVEDGKPREIEDCIEYYPKSGKHRVTYGSMFTILQREGFNVTGTPEHFTCILDNGDTYEFSYDFWRDRDYYGSYYLKNGEEVQTKATEKSVLTHDEILEIFGLYIDFDGGPYMWNDKKNS